MGQLFFSLSFFINIYWESIMKKRWIVLGIILVMVIIVFGFLMERNKQEIDSVSGVTIEIKEGTLTPTGATIIITDTTDKNNSYGEAYRIDKKEDGKWMEVSRIIDNAFFNDIAYLLDDNNQIVREVDWEWIYGRLKPGRYRFVTYASDMELSISFSIK